MSVSLNKDQLSLLLERLRDKVDSIIIRGEIKSHLDGITSYIDFVVDAWPDFRAVVGRISPIQTREIELPGFFEHRVVVYCTDDDALVTLLHQPGVLDWSKRHIFLFPRKSTGAVMMKGIPDRSLGVEENLHLMIVRHDTLKLLPLPEGFQILPVQPEQASLVNSSWKFNMGKDSELYILKVIKSFPSCCMYDAQGNVVGFAIQYHNGALGMLYVYEDYRGKGYGKLIMSNLAQACLDRQSEVFSLLDNENEVSISLHESVGFADYGVAHVVVKTLMK